MTHRPSARRLRAPFAAAAVLLLALGGCRDRAQPPDAPRATLTVGAAASLRDVLAELEPAFEAAHPGVDVRVSYGASGALRAQVEQGAPMDVFVSAADAPMDALAASGLVEARTRRVLAGNDLVLIAPASADASLVTDWADLAKPAVARVALGAPASVPAGDYAAETLGALGLSAAVEGKTVLGQNVRQVLGFVETGNADAGVVYRTDAASSKGVRVVAAAPAGTHRPIVYPVAVVAASERPEAAQAYVAFLLGAEGRAALRRHGFRVDG